MGKSPISMVHGFQHAMFDDTGGYSTSIDLCAPHCQFCIVGLFRGQFIDGPSMPILVSMGCKGQQRWTTNDKKCLTIYYVMLVDINRETSLWIFIGILNWINGTLWEKISRPVWFVIIYTLSNSHIANWKITIGNRVSRYPKNPWFVIIVPIKIAITVIFSPPSNTYD